MKAMNSKKPISILEIFLMILGVVAISYSLGSLIPEVSAQNYSGYEAVSPPPATPQPTDVEIEGLLMNAGITTVTQEMIEKVRGLLGSKGLEGAVSEVATEAGASASSSPGFFKSLFGKGEGFGDTWAAGGVTAIIAVVWTFISVGLTTGDWNRAAESAGTVAIGAGAGLGAYAGAVALGLGPAGWIASAFVLVGVWASRFLKKQTDRQIDFMCVPWQAQSGGENCDLCNGGLFPCTEYQCKSLGAACELVNKDTDDAACVWKDPRDVSAPNIIAWEEPLFEGYRYTPLPTGPTGVEIKYQNEECLPAFQPFAFGIELDKEGYCKIDFERKDSFEEMDFNFGGKNLLKMQHDQILSFPGVVHIQDFLDQLESEEGSELNITNDGEYEIYVRCESANGVSNIEEYLFKFCVDKGPDTTSPIIRGFDKADGSYVGYFGDEEEREISIQAYTNEPATCKWDHEDKDYEDMLNNLTCSSSAGAINSQLSYTCSGVLDGLKNDFENQFFFRCNDTMGNVNAQSRTLSLIGTTNIVIDEVSPDNETIKDSTNSIKITLEAETSAGANRGIASCEYSPSGETSTYIKFTDTDSHTHSTNLWLGEGDYQYYIRCRDEANNADTAHINFTVETDTQAPLVVRAFREGNNLKIITTEEASCVYSTYLDNGCSYDFDQGISMTSDSEGLSHTTDWNANRNLYIKCQDEFGNQPAEGQCSLTVNPFDIE